MNIQRMKWILTTLTYFASIHSMLAETILIIGDSIDRYVTNDWCESQNQSDVTLSIWGRDWYRYAGGNALMCYNSRTNDSLTISQILGSKSTGPYYRDWKYDPDDPFHHTSVRIEKIMTHYAMTNGKPSKIVFSTQAWDCLLAVENNDGKILIESDENWSNSLEYFQKNVNARLDEIMRLKAEETQVCLRTTARFAMCGGLVAAMNDIIRNIASSRNLTIFDMDLDLWSIFDFDYSAESMLFRDGNHPQRFFTPTLGHKLLSRQFTNFIYHKGSRPHRNHIWSLKDFATDFIIKVVKPQIAGASFSDGPLYFTEIVNGTRHIWTHLHHSSLRYMGLGVGDIVAIHEEEVTSLTKGGRAPTHMFQAIPDRTQVVRSTSGTTFVVARGSGIVRELVDPLANPSTLQAWNVTMVELVCDIDDMWMRNMHREPPVPNVYSDNTLIRWKDERTVFVVINCTRRLFPNLPTFIRLGFDFGDVITVEMKEDVYMLPQGEDMV